MSVYKKVNTFTGVSEKDRFINTFLGLIFYFVCTDIINLVRIPLKRKINRLIWRIRDRKNVEKESHHDRSEV